MNMKLTRKQNSELIAALLIAETDEDRVQVFYDHGQGDKARELQLQIRARLVIAEIGTETMYPLSKKIATLISFAAFKGLKS